MLLHYFWYNLYIKCYNFENILLSLQRIYNMQMKQIEYVTIKNASNKVLKKMRQIGEEKAQRLQKIHPVRGQVPGMQVAKRLGEERFFSGAFVVFRMLTDLSTSVEMIK